MSYATLAQLKSAVRIDDGLDDAELEIALDSASELIDKFCGRSFTEANPDADASTSRVFTPVSPRLVFIDDAVEIDSVEERITPTSDYETVDADDWEAEPGNAEADGRPYTRLRRRTGGWPKGRSAVRVTGWFGWPEMPQAVKQAEILQASRLAQRRNAPFGIQTIPSMDQTSGMRLLAKLDADVEILLSGLRRDGTVPR